MLLQSEAGYVPSQRNWLQFMKYSQVAQAPSHEWAVTLACSQPGCSYFGSGFCFTLWDHKLQSCLVLLLLLLLVLLIFVANIEFRVSLLL